MKYAYNYSFLEQWIQENGKIQKKEVLKALGIKSNNGLKAWTDKKGPMPVLSIIRFCNSFQVPIACFFRDLETDNVINFTPERPNINDQLEPEGGYDQGERGRGYRNLEDPTKCTPRQSNLPTEYKDCTVIEPISSLENIDTSNKQQNTIKTTESNIDSNALIILENKHCDERKKLLDIIIEQQKKIDDLSKQISLAKQL